MSERDLINMVRRHFLPFAGKAFNIVNPGQECVPTPAFLAISHMLSEVWAGRIQRLLINVPPRSGKSVLSSVAFPAFVLGQDPTRRIICASYSGELAAKLSRDCRTVMQHPSYRTLFPRTAITGKNTESEFETAHGGCRFSTSVGGTLTGRGGNLIIIDDPLKPDEAMSDLARERVWDWFTGTVGSRLDNKSEDAIIVVMQRVHVDDLAGRLIERGGWEVLSIPAIADTQQVLPVTPGRSLVRNMGDVLDPVREPREILDQVKRELGSATFEAQYQQQPVPEEGGLLKWSWFKTYEAPPTQKAYDLIVISWDCALSDREVNDYSVGVVALVKSGLRDIYILDVIRERLDFPSLCKRVELEADRRHADMTVIEHTGSGISLLQQQKSRRRRVCSIVPEGDKVVRFSAVTPMIEGGQVHLPASAPWLAGFKRELLSFPKSKNDDQVDAFSQLLVYIKRKPGRSIVSSYSAQGGR